jgi:hypothetical protein
LSLQAPWQDHKSCGKTCKRNRGLEEIHAHARQRIGQEESDGAAVGDEQEPTDSADHRYDDRSDTAKTIAKGALA